MLLDRTGNTLLDEVIRVDTEETTQLVVTTAAVVDPRPVVTSRGRPVWVRTQDGWDLQFER